MPDHPIYNLDHGQRSPTEIALDGVTILINNEHVQALQGMHANGSVATEVAVDKDGVRSVETQRPEVPGSWMVTAILRVHEDPMPRSHLASHPQAQSPEFDFCLLASFLSGRRVCTEDQLGRYRHDVHSDGAVDLSEFLKSIKVAWAARSTFPAALLPALWYTCAGDESHELSVKAALFTTALDVVSEYYWKKSKKPPFSNEVRDALVEKLKLVVIAEKLPDDAHKDVVDKFIPIGKPSALSKLQHLLMELDVAPSGGSVEFEDRMQCVNAVRNKYVHTGSPPGLSKCKDDTDRDRLMDGVSMIVAGIVPQIVKLALLVEMGFGIKCASLRVGLRELQDYFRTGDFRGLRVGEETRSESEHRHSIPIQIRIVGLGGEVH